MGQFRLWQLVKSMIERKFGDAKGAEPVGFSHSDFDFIVETLNHAAGELLFGLEIVEDEFAMSPKGFGNFLHWVNTGAHGLLTPEVEIPASPGRGVVVPEAL